MITSIILLFVVIGCANKKKEQAVSKTNEKVGKTDREHFDWKAATVYFLLTDRFNNGNKKNDVNFDRSKKTAVLRGFEGGDIQGVTQKINEGYFSKLGVNALWLTPIVEQIHGGTDEGTGLTYGFHGYWTKDWTALDPNFGTREDLAELVETAHAQGIRILLDAVINHTGPVTDKDPVWPKDWVRTSPTCTYESYETTVQCTLVDNLPDILTESDENVELPPQLVEKWKKEGRYEQEMKELDAFFERTGHPRAPRFYIMKWLSDYITDFGIDGYRVDTVRHTEEYVWEEFREVCDDSFAEWKAKNPGKILDDNSFYLVGEIYGYRVQEGQYSDFGDRKVRYFGKSFDALINFDLRSSADRSYEQVFSEYSNLLHKELAGYSTLSYLTSHDDGSPYDKERKKTYETATRLLLAPGAAQIYYGDEVGRSLIIKGTVGDATLRSPMDWKAIESNSEMQKLKSHWEKLGRFRRDHPAIGAGKHKIISKSPYVFTRVYSEKDFSDSVVVALDLETKTQSIPVGDIFSNGQKIREAYSGKILVVKDGKVSIKSTSGIALLESIKN